ncbi:MAG TPA: ankyrin repeat domain-containing protein, partial [Thermoanaerobaculia bacterium]
MRRLALLIIYIMFNLACHYGPTSPAAAAASGGDVAAMKRMLDAGLDPNAHDSAGYTPLIAAARAGNVEMIRLLTSRGANPNLADAAVNSWTPLLHAVHKAQPRALAALLD